MYAADGLSLRPILTLLGRDTVLDELGAVDLPPLAVGDWHVRLPPDPTMHRISVKSDDGTLEISLSDD